MPREGYRYRVAGELLRVICVGLTFVTVVPPHGSAGRRYIPLTRWALMAAVECGR
jgi:hypothetical protein